MILTIFGLTAASLAVDSAPLSPSGQWSVNYADNSCLVSRTFGTGDEQTILALRLIPGSTSQDLMVTGPGASRMAQGKVFVGFEPTGTKLPRTFAGGKTSTGAVVLTTPLTLEDMSLLAKSKSIAFQQTGRPVALDIGSAAKVLAAAKTCEDDLLRNWGIDPAVQASIAKRPTFLGRPQSWITDDDYPQEARRANAQGPVTFRVHVDAAGNIADCGIVVSSGNAALDGAVCPLVRKRAQFGPATTAAGTPVPTVIVTRFNWRLP